MAARVIAKPAAGRAHGREGFADEGFMDDDIELWGSTSRHQRRRERKHKKEHRDRRHGSTRLAKGIGMGTAAVLVALGFVLVVYQWWLRERLVRMEAVLDALQKSHKHHRGRNHGRGEREDRHKHRGHDEDDEEEDDDEEEEDDDEKGKSEGKQQWKNVGADVTQRLDQYFWMTASSLTVAQRLEALRPLAWVHVPFSADLFVNTLLTHQGLCPSYPTAALTFEEIRAGKFMEKAAAACTKSFLSNYDSPPHSVGFGDAYFRSVGHAVIMLRQPERRLAAGFIADGSAPQGRDIAELATKRRGCAVTMMLKPGLDVCDTVSGAVVTEKEATQAVKFLEQGFAFVGIVEAWDLSVCLFHQMFGGACHAFELRQNFPALGAIENVTELADRLEVDVLDAKVYRAGQSRFERDKKLYNVTQSLCSKLCTS